MSWMGVHYSNIRLLLNGLIKASRVKRYVGFYDTKYCCNYYIVSVLTRTTPINAVHHILQLLRHR